MISPTRESVGKDGKKRKYPSKARQCQLLGIARSTCYYNRKDGESQTNLKMMELMDKQYDQCPAMGVRQMVCIGHVTWLSESCGRHDVPDV